MCERTKGDLTYVLSPIARKPREIKTSHRRLVDLEDKELFPPVLIAIWDTLDDVNSLKGRHKKGPKVLIVSLHQNEMTKLVEAEQQTFFASLD